MTQHGTGASRSSNEAGVGPTMTEHLDWPAVVDTNAFGHNRPGPIPDDSQQDSKRARI